MLLNYFSIRLRQDAENALSLARCRRSVDKSGAVTGWLVAFGSCLAGSEVIFFVSPEAQANVVYTRVQPEGCTAKRIPHPMVHQSAGSHVSAPLSATAYLVCDWYLKELSQSTDFQVCANANLA
jgi:hypothetical protein